MRKADIDKNVDQISEDYCGVEVTCHCSIDEGAIWRIILDESEIITGSKLDAISDVVLKFYEAAGMIEFTDKMKVEE